MLMNFCGLIHVRVYYYYYVLLLCIMLSTLLGHQFMIET